MSGETVRLKNVASVRVSNVDKKTVEGEAPIRLCNYTDVYYADRITDDREFMEATATADQIATFRLRRGQTLITKDSETADDIGIPAYVDTDAADLICGYHLAQITPDPSAIDPRFLYWAIASQRSQEQFSLAASGVTRFGLRTDAITGLELAKPRRYEQRRIADFLDAETSRIDALITAKQQMIATVRDRHEALISDQLTTEGVSRVQFRRLMATPPAYGAAEAGEAIPASTDWLRYIRITDINEQGNLRPEGAKYLSPEIARPYILADLDLLFARSGATVGKAFLYRTSMSPSAFAGYLIRVQVEPTIIDPRLLIYWTQSRDYWDQILSTALQATIENVSAERYKDLLVPVPVLRQQPQILARLDHSRSRTESLIAALTRQIALLRERRQALITAAVTGELTLT